MSEAGELRDVCDELLGSLDAAIAMVERIAAEGLGVAALMRVHRASRIGARRLLAGLPELPVRDDDTEDLLQGFSGRAGNLAPSDAAIDAPMPVAQATPPRVELADDDDGDEDDTAQGALREQPLDEDEAGPPAAGEPALVELTDEYVSFDEPLVRIDEDRGAGAAPSYVTYDEPAPALPEREAVLVRGPVPEKSLVESDEDVEPLSVASVSLGSASLVEFDEPLVRSNEPAPRRDEEDALFGGMGSAPTPNLARLAPKAPPAQRERGARPETFDLMPDVEDTDVGLKPLPVSATSTDLEAVEDDNSAGEVVIPPQVTGTLSSPKAPARPMIVRPAARGGSSAAARVAAKTGAAASESAPASSDSRLVPAPPADGAGDATPGTVMGRSAAPPPSAVPPAVSEPVAAPKSAARSQRPAPGSVPTIREGGDARPRGAAILIGTGDQAGAPKVLGLEEEFEPLEMGEADGDVPAGEGFQIQVEEYDDVYETIEEEEPSAMPVPAPPPPPRVGPGKAELRALLDQAHEAAKSGENERAVDLFSDVLDADPDNVEAHIGRGRLYLDLADYARAMSDFTVAEDIEEASPEPQVAIGDLYFARKDYRKAIDYFTVALEMSPNHAMAYCRRGISHYYRKNYAEALDDLLRAQRIDNEIANISTFVAMAKKKAPAPPPRR